MDFFGNDDRKSRCDDLIGHINDAKTAMLEAQRGFEAKTDFFRDVCLQAAQAKGYPTIDELIADAQRYMEDPDADAAEAWTKFENYQDTLGKAVYGLGTISFVTSIGMAARMKYRYKKNLQTSLLPGFISSRMSWNRANSANVWKNAALYQLSTVERRKIEVDSAKGNIHPDLADLRRKLLDADIKTVQATDAADFNPDKPGKFTTRLDTVRLESIKGFKKLSKLTDILETAGFVADVLAIITDAIVGAVMRDRLREAINKTAAHRFAIKKFEIMCEVYDLYVNNLSAAVKTWVDNQAAAYAGGSCYKTNDDAIEKALADAYVELGANMVTVCDCAVLKRLREDDQTINSWTNEDPSYKEMMMILDPELDPNSIPNDPTEDCPYHDANYNEVVFLDEEEEDAAPVVDTIYPAIVQGSQVTVSDCKYVELQGGRGALWRILGGFWTLQQPLDVDVSSEPEGLASSRIRFKQHRQTHSPTKIYLQNIDNWTPPNMLDPSSANDDFTPPSDSSQLYPIVVLDFSTGRLNILPGTTNVHAPTGTGTPWGGRLLDLDSKTNLPLINGWTLSLAPVVDDFVFPAPPGEDPAEFQLDNAHECSRIDGWHLAFDANPFLGRVEVSRDKTTVKVATRKRGGALTWPKAEVDTERRLIRFQYEEPDNVEDESDENYDVYPVSTEGENRWNARVNFT